MEQALVLLKPDTYERKLMGKIITRLEEKNFKITYISLEQFSEDVYKEHYNHLKNLTVFVDIIDFMVSGPVLVMILEGEGVIEGTRKLMGKTKWLEAEPGTIRGDFACNTTQNLIHCSDSPENAKEEIRRFAGEEYINN